MKAIRESQDVGPRVGLFGPYDAHLPLRNTKQTMKHEREGFIEDFIRDTAGIVETSSIYQDIIDEVFFQEMQAVSEDPDFVEAIEIQKNMQTQKSTLLRVGLQKYKELFE